jgi:hypothetical protein
MDARDHRAPDPGVSRPSELRRRVRAGQGRRRTARDTTETPAGRVRRPCRQAGRTLSPSFRRELTDRIRPSAQKAPACSRRASFSSCQLRAQQGCRSGTRQRGRSSRGLGAELIRTAVSAGVAADGASGSRIQPPVTASDDLVSCYWLTSGGYAPGGLRLSRDAVSSRPAVNVTGPRPRAC